MADSSYFRSPSRRELREKRLQRKDARQATCRVLGALDSIKRTGGVYEEPDVHLTTEIPKEMLPKEPKKKAAPSESIVARQATNAAYEADLKSRAPPAPAKRPIVSAEHALPISWEVAKQGKNDNSAVQSKLAYTRGKGEAPAVYTPAEDEAANPRKEVAAKRAAREALKVPPQEKVKPFEYTPSVQKLPPGQAPRVVEMQQTTANPDARRHSVTKPTGIHGRAFH